jgi:hypothetical protein
MKHHPNVNQKRVGGLFSISNKSFHTSQLVTKKITLYKEGHYLNGDNSPRRHVTTK